MTAERWLKMSSPSEQYMLQWGRDLVTAESGVEPLEDDRTFHGFNGAAIW